jgi:predicted MFS family arabinose efflux permease
VVIFLAILVVHPREPVKSEAIIKQEPVTWKPFRKPLFWLVALSVFLQGLANMLPATYIPTYATNLGISSTKASLLLTVLNICGMVGQVAFGFLM